MIKKRPERGVFSKQACLINLYFYLLRQRFFRLGQRQAQNTVFKISFDLLPVYIIIQPE
jgi:hypothetical protein